MPHAFNPAKFIDEVKLRPGLYNPDRVRGYDRTERLELWKEVGAAMFPDWAHCDKSTAYGRVLQLQKKWKSLRDAYNRELRIRKTTGSKRSRIVYRYFKRMSFLGGFEGSVSSHDGSSPEGDDLDFVTQLETDSPLKEESVPSEEAEPLPKVKKIKKKKRKRQTRRRESVEDIPEIEETNEEVEMPMFPMEFSGESENDTDRLFLLSFVPEMRQLPIHLKMWTRAQIANIMQEAVSSHYNNVKPGCSTDNVQVKRFKPDSPES